MTFEVTYETLYRIDAPHFVAGLGIAIDDIVNWTAPIIGYMVGWDRHRVIDYCREKNWTIEIVGGYDRARHRENKT